MTLLARAKFLFDLQDVSYDDALLKKRYRELVLKYHPDKGGDENIFKEIDACYECLQLHLTPFALSAEKCKHDCWCCERPEIQNNSSNFEVTTDAWNDCN